MTPKKECVFYVQIVPDFSYRPDKDGIHRVRAIKATKVTQKRPGVTASGAVVVALTVRIPEEAFHPLRPQAVVEIETEMTDTRLVEVDVTDPNLAVSTPDDL